MTIFSGVFRLGRDAELRYTPGGDPVCSLSLAYNYGKKGDDGKRPSQWIDAALWGKQAEALAQYLTKGKQVFVTLSDLHIETFEGKNGHGSKLVGRVASIELVGSRTDSQPAEPAAARPDRALQPAAAADDYADDIPF